MDSFFPFNHWPHSASIPAWTQAWPEYPVMPLMVGSEFGQQPQQLQQLQQQPQSTDQSEQSELHEMKPLAIKALMDQNHPQSPSLSPSSSSTDGSHGDFRFEMQLDLTDRPALLTPPLEPPSVSIGEAPLVPPEAVEGGKKTKSARKIRTPKEVKKEIQPQQKRGRKRKIEVADDEGEESSLQATAAKRATPDSSTETALAPYVMPDVGGDIFCKVVGRLSVVGSQKTYNVSVAEIHRRTDFPEALNRSHIGTLLRRGKIAGCGDDLQALLEKRGLSSTGAIVVNRKRYPLTTLNALLEEEAVLLSADHKELVRSQFPFTVLARLVVVSFKSPMELTTAANEVKAAKVEMANLLSLLSEWTNGGWELGLDTIVSSHLRQFAFLTHAFGVQELMVMAELFNRFLNILDLECDAHFARLDLLTHNNAFAAMLPQFPPGMRQPELPKGSLYKAEVDEEAASTGSFAEIPGRLTLINKKYNVTVAEIYRRIRAPESLNLSLLGSHLRKGKTKDNCNALKDILKSSGISIEVGRRKSHRVTCFTAMVEAEAIALAKDVEEEATRSFPFVPLVDKLIEQSPILTPQVITARSEGFRCASRIAGSLENALVSFRLPVAERVPHMLNEYAFTMLNYSSLTHGYGPDAVVYWMGNFKKIFAIANRQMENKA